MHMDTLEPAAQAFADGTAKAQFFAPDAYIPVRAPNGPERDGSILVYLPNGTGLVVNNAQLLHAAGANAPDASD
jgi:hypothetical protein